MRLESRLLAAAIGAAMSAAGFLLMLVFFAQDPLERSLTIARAMAVGQLGGCAVLVLAYLSLIRTKFGGVGPLIGAVALPCGQIYFYLHMRDYYYIETTIALLGLAYALFALGHALTRGIAWYIRALAVLAVIAVYFSFSAEAGRWAVSYSTKRTLYLATFGLLAAGAGAVAAHYARALRSQN